MANIVKLSYTASEIDEKLGKIDENSANISSISEDYSEMDAEVKTLSKEVIAIDSEIRDLLYVENQILNNKDGANVSQRVALYFTTPTYIKRIKPIFAETTGTFTWCIGKSDTDIVNGTTIMLGEKNTLNIGDSIYLGKKISERSILVIESESNIRCTLPSATPELASAKITKLNGDKIFQKDIFSTYYFAGEFVLQNEDNEKYVSEEKVEEIFDEKSTAIKLDISDIKEQSLLLSNLRVPKIINIDAKIDTNKNLNHVLYFETPRFVTKINPVFNVNSGEFTWLLLYSESEITDNIIPITLETHTQSVNEPIIINRILSKNCYIAILNTSEIYLKYNSTVGESKIANYNLTSGKISQLSSMTKFSFGGVVEYYDADSNIKSNLTGKKIVAIGDSMVKGHTLADTQTWLYKLANKNGMTYVNRGINGCCLSNNANNVYGADLSVYQRVSDNTNAAYMNDENVDYLVVFAGTNDANINIELGETSVQNTDNTTFYGAINMICNELQTRYPTTTIIFITPYRRNDNYIPYINAIEYICEYYGISVFNNAKNGGINWNNDTQVTELTMGDTYHLNEIGHDFASRRYEAFLK